jgi:hypothetical protein
MGNRSIYKFIRCICVACFFCCCQQASASDQDSTKVQKDSTRSQYKLYINAGAYFPEATTTIQINGQHGLGSVISVEDLLHVDRHPVVFSANLLWKITRRSTLSARYFHYQVTGEFGNSEHQFTIRDTVVDIGATLKTKLTHNYFGLNYNYAVFSQKQWSAGLSLGLRTSITAIKLNYEVQGKSGEYKNSLPIPIILWGLFTEGYMAPRLRGTYSFEMFRLSINGISGLVYENRFGLEYYIIKNVGIGFSYNQIFYKLKEIPFSDRLDGEFSYNLSGLQLNLHARF